MRRVLSVKPRLAKQGAARVSQSERAFSGQMRDAREITRCNDNFLVFFQHVFLGRREIKNRKKAPLAYSEEAMQLVYEELLQPVEKIRF